MITHPDRPGYRISTDPNDIDFEGLHEYLSQESYWSKNIPKEVLRRAVNNSFNFSVLDLDGKFVGFARTITDFATFAYLGDVYIKREQRGRGLGKWLIQTIMDHPRLQGLRNWFLYTKDAHELYTKFGWKKLEDRSRAMIIKNPAEELYVSEENQSAQEKY